MTLKEEYTVSEEKRLNDEAVESVTGGGLSQEEWEPFSQFNANNCAICEVSGSCSFKSTFDAFRQLGGQDCPDFRGRRGKSY